MTTDWLNHAWFAWPVAVLLLASLALVPLGQQVLKRGVVFIDLAVAQAAAAAALLCGAWVDHPGPWVSQAAATAGALTAAAAVYALARAWPEQREALIGLVYVLAACLALLAARVDPHGAQRLAALLAADVLWAGWPKALAAAAAWAGVALCRSRLDNDAWFYGVFAIAASLTVPVLGLFLVFALLIANALWVARGTSARAAQLQCAAATWAGLALSWWLDWPSGTCVAATLALWGLSAGAYKRKHAQQRNGSVL